MNMPEVNIASLVQNMIGSIKSLAVNMIKERIRQRIGNAASNIFLNWLQGVIGVESPDFRFPKGLPYWRLGHLLEDVVQDIICRVVPKGRDLAYFEPKIRQKDGVALENGYTCHDRPSSRGKPKRGERFPDLLMRNHPPKSPLYGTLVISEVKLSASTFYDSWLRGGRRSRLGQWRAIWKHELAYSYPPRALLLISLRPGAQWIHKRLRKEWRSKGLYGRLVTLL